MSEVGIEDTLVIDASAPEVCTRSRIPPRMRAGTPS
jgi:hypothetical protein